MLCDLYSVMIKLLTSNIKIR